MKRKIIIGVLIFVVSCGVIYAATLTKDMRQKLENIRTVSSVYDRHNQLIGNLYYYQRIWTPIEKIPRNLQRAVIAIEDSRFYQHNGIDLRGLARAMVHNAIPGGPMEGGSTITQQLAKISLLTADRTVMRKVQDITLALQIEQSYTKQEILELYLNSIYLAHGNVGVEAASRYYFGKPANRISLAQAALLAGMIQSPENYSPFKHPREAKNRRNLVLKNMLQQHFITNQQYQSAVASGLGIIQRGESAATGAYYLDYVRSFLINQEGYTEEELRFGGYKIYTTLDAQCQKEAEQAILGVPHNLPAKVQPQGAMVTLDPRTGEILAMVGGRNYAESQYNRALKSYRQPGSAIKPFVYATAIEKGFNAATIIEDKPLQIPLVNGSIWSPENYERTFRGRIPLRVALRHSVNMVAVQLLQAVGIDAVVELMERMGIDSLVKTGPVNDLNLAPLALGGLSKGVTPLELAAAYTPFANQGNYAKPFAVRKVLDRHGNFIKDYTGEARPAISPQTAYIMTMLMQDVVDQGTGFRAKLPDRPAAGKTGTSSDYTNAWFVGYTQDLLTAVWIGNDRQGQPMTYKTGNIGSATAAEIWGNYMKRVTAKRPVVEFSQPPGIVWADVNPQNGEIAIGPLTPDSYKEVFDEKHLPDNVVTKTWNWLFPGKKPVDETLPEGHE